MAAGWQWMEGGAHQRVKSGDGDEQGGGADSDDDGDGEDDVVKPSDDECWNDGRLIVVLTMVCATMN